jgi:hypothetical protein
MIALKFKIELEMILVIDEITKLNQNDSNIMLGQAYTRTVSQAIHAL